MVRLDTSVSMNTWHFIPARKNRNLQWRWEHRNKRHEVLRESETAFAGFAECVEDARAYGYTEPYKRKATVLSPA